MIFKIYKIADKDINMIIEELLTNNSFRCAVQEKKITCCEDCHKCWKNWFDNKELV